MGKYVKENNIAKPMGRGSTLRTLWAGAIPSGPHGQGQYPPDPMGRGNTIRTPWAGAIPSGPHGQGQCPPDPWGRGNTLRTPWAGAMPSGPHGQGQYPPDPRLYGQGQYPPDHMSRGNRGNGNRNLLPPADADVQAPPVHVEFPPSPAL